MDTSDNLASASASLSSNNKGVSDASNTPSSLMSKTISSSTRPSTSTDKENLPAIDKQHRPSTANMGNTSFNEHSATNGNTTPVTTTNGLPNPLLASTSIDASTNNSSGYMSMKTSASGVQTGNNAIINRAHPGNKFRAETVRLPNNTVVPRRETLDRVPSNTHESIKKLDSINNNDRNKPISSNGNERYDSRIVVCFSLLFFFFHMLRVLFSHVYCNAWLCFASLRTAGESRIPLFTQRLVSIVDMIDMIDRSVRSSSFIRSSTEASSSQVPHHVIRASARETSNTKSASLSATSSSTTQQSQNTSKIPDKFKCVLFLFELSSDKKIVVGIPLTTSQ
jgi:hypothetical protein